MKLTKLTKKQIQVLWEMVQDPMSFGEFFEDKNLWPAYSNLSNKVRKLAETVGVEK